MGDNDNAYSDAISPGTPASTVDAATLDGASLSTDGTFANDSDILIPSEKAVKTFVEDITDSLDSRIDDYELNVVIDDDGDVVIPNDLAVTGALAVTGSAAITSKVGAETLSLSIADGTTPMSITSTTKVANLNVEQVDGCDVEDSDTLGTSDVKLPTQGNVKTYVDNAALITGVPVPFDKDNPSTPTMPSSFKECDGSLIDDSESVYDQQRIENLNGADVALTLTWTADAGGAYATVPTADLYALTLEDDVSGTGIAADSYITDITSGVVTISDVSATGEIESTFTNDGKFIGGAEASGTGKKDHFQGSYPKLYVQSAATTTGDVQAARSGAGLAGPASSRTSAYLTEFYDTYSIYSGFNEAESYGTPRPDTNTYPTHRRYVYIKKIK